MKDNAASTTRPAETAGGRDVLEHVEPGHYQRWWQQQHGLAWLAALAALISALATAWALWVKPSLEVTITSVQVFDTMRI